MSKSRRIKNICEVTGLNGYTEKKQLNPELLFDDVDVFNGKGKLIGCVCYSEELEPLDNGSKLYFIDIKDLNDDDHYLDRGFNGEFEVCLEERN